MWARTEKDDIEEQAKANDTPNGTPTIAETAALADEARIDEAPVELPETVAAQPDQQSAAPDNEKENEKAENLQNELIQDHANSELEDEAFWQQAEAQFKPQEADKASAAERSGGYQSDKLVERLANSFEYVPTPPDILTPPTPPNATDYRRMFWNEAPALKPEDLVANREALPPVHRYEQAVPNPGASSSADRYTGNIPAGFERTPADVSRAAWTGLLFGWFLGRRGKRKAVEQARSEAQAQTENSARLRPPEQYQTPSLEVETTVARPSEALPAPDTALPAPDTRSSLKMNHKELLKIAKNIKIDGVRLKDVYAAKRIDQEGLRAVVETYLRGGNVKEKLAGEIIAKEQSFERDPLLRHQRSSGQIKALMTQASAVAQEQGTKLATSSRKSAKKYGKLLAKGAKQAQHDIIDDSNTADWLSITAIVVVYSLILVLLLR